MKIIIEKHPPDDMQKFYQTGEFPPSKTEQAVIDMIRIRSVVGAYKYKTTMDRTDLTLSEWAQHAQEELLDGAQYLERVKNAGDLLERARKVFATLANERGWEHAADWIADYDRQFTTK